MSERELPPTEEKIRRAREKGQLGVSQDVITLLKLAIVFELAVALETAIRDGIGQLVSTALLVLQSSPSHPFSVRMAWVWEATLPLALIMLAFVLVAAAVSWLGNLVQTRMNIATKVFAESLKKLNPISNLKQILSGQKLLMLVLGPLKIASVLIVVSRDVWGAIDIALQADRLYPWMLWHITLIAMREILHSALLVLVFWTILDFGLQRWLTRRSLRMDIKELRDEYKNMEGDPHAKGFRKETGKEIIFMNKQPDSKPAVVVVNPEHFVVALAYDYQAETVPTVVGKGVGEAVQYWKQFAKTECIPVIRFPSLARQLYAAGRVGHHVPSPMLAAVALLLQAALEATQASQVDRDFDAVYEIDEDIAKEMLASAPSHW